MFTENTCLAGRSDVACTVLSSSVIKVILDENDSTSELCNVAAGIKNFFEEVYNGGDVEGINEVGFKGSDYDCLLFSNIIDEERSSTQGSINIQNHTTWYFVGSSTLVLFIVAFVNGTKAARSRQRSVDSIIESDSLKGREDNDVEDNDSYSGTISLASKSLFSGAFDWTTVIIDAQPTGSDTSEENCGSNTGSRNLSNVSKSLLSGSFDMNNAIVCDASIVSYL